MSKPEKTVNDFTRVILEVLTKDEGPTAWANNQGIPEEVIQHIVEILDFSLVELTKGEDSMPTLTAYRGILVTAFMFGWECGIELGR
jgi:hypothetical protein